MERIPEPELMNEASQAQAYAQADFSEPHTHFVSLFVEKFPNLDVTGNVLDLGCGPGDVTRRFARAYPACSLHGIDGASNMLALGREANRQAGLAERIDLFEINLPCVTLPRSQYDAVISNSLLHHLHDPMVLWHSVQRFAASGAPVFIMDLRRPDSVLTAQTLVTSYAENEPDVLREDFLASLCAAFTPEEIEAQLSAVALGHLQVQVVSDRHLIIYGRMP